MEYAQVTFPFHPDADEKVSSKQDDDELMSKAEKLLASMAFSEDDAAGLDKASSGSSPVQADDGGVAIIDPTAPLKASVPGAGSSVASSASRIRSKEE